MKWGWEEVLWYVVTMARQYVWMLLMQGAVQKPLADDQTMADGVVVVWWEREELLLCWSCLSGEWWGAVL